MTVALTALSFYTGIHTVRDLFSFTHPIELSLEWLAEVAGIMGLCGLCVHVALAWLKSLFVMRTVAVVVTLASGVLIGMSVSVYLGLNSSSVYLSPREYTHGELFATLYCLLVVTVIFTTGVATFITAAVTYARAGAKRIPIAIFGMGALLTSTVGVMGYARLEVGYPKSDPVAWAITAAAVGLYGLAVVTNQRIKADTYQYQD
ncbi:hypothetical protein [Nocardia sp. CS682]|uniref:hypothetical protein n=1 Tax=Nocardia sp. CS682 TaxID=1047172 RepID=UPI001074F94F|nr:hypothetical protein [Nocardia sp. CS682]QBS43829.1 hypothetical protein DMB37_30775 [Nocardia sp. CS682]